MKLYIQQKYKLIPMQDSPPLIYFKSVYMNAASKKSSNVGY